MKFRTAQESAKRESQYFTGERITLKIEDDASRVYVVARDFDSRQVAHLYNRAHSEDTHIDTARRSFNQYLKDEGYIHAV